VLPRRKDKELFKVEEHYGFALRLGVASHIYDFGLYSA